jgi:hypothetical protein
MLKENYAMLKREIWITTKFTSRRGFGDLSPLNRTPCRAHSDDGASLGVVGDSCCTSFDGELDDDPFSLHTCLVGKLKIDGGHLSFTSSSFSSLFSSSFFSSSIVES